MKRGRKRAAVEKTDKYDPAALMQGSNPDAYQFCIKLKRLTKSFTWTAVTYRDISDMMLAGLRKDPRFDIDQMAIFLAKIGKLQPDQLARFFDDVAKFIRSDTFTKGGPVDAERSALAMILKAKDPKIPVGITDLQTELGWHGVSPSPRWISDECKKLRYLVRVRGRH